MQLKRTFITLAPLIENQYVIYIFILLTIVFFILSLSIKLNEIIKILLLPFMSNKKDSKFIQEAIKKKLMLVPIKTF